MFKRKIILINGNEILFGKEKIPYENLCKIVKIKEKFNVVVLNKNMVFREIEVENKLDIYKFIEKEFLEYNNQHLIHYEKINGRKKVIIYAIRSSRIIENITSKFINARIIPIEVFIKNILRKDGRYNIRYLENEYEVWINNGILYSGIKNDENIIKGNLIINRQGGEVFYERGNV
ncbi:MAG: hypothetical protein ACRDDY_07825 [Clostridium sp.]|uniref:hypothetical protein n=1 Tax=Clostridium sp. TaxID=1506 RepID=UPI003EE6B8E5